MNSRIRNELERKSCQATNPTDFRTRTREGKEKRTKKRKTQKQKETRRQRIGTTGKRNREEEHKRAREETRTQRQTGWAGEALEVRVCEDVCVLGSVSVRL